MNMFVTRLIYCSHFLSFTPFPWRGCFFHVPLTKVFRQRPLPFFSPDEHHKRHHNATFSFHGYSNNITEQIWIYKTWPGVLSCWCREFSSKALLHRIPEFRNSLAGKYNLFFPNSTSPGIKMYHGYVFSWTRSFSLPLMFTGKPVPAGDSFSL